MTLLGGEKEGVCCTTSVESVLEDHAGDKRWLKRRKK